MSRASLQVPDVYGAIAIIIRHAERHPIGPMTGALTAPLTSRGMEDATVFGSDMARFGRVSLYHSPVPRCRETAECIGAGLAAMNAVPELIGHLPELGGPYITGTWEDVASLVDRLGQSRFIRTWFDGGLPDRLIMPLPDAAQAQLAVLAGQLRTETRSTVNITHDWNIMLLREYYFNLRHEDIGEPGYLDGLWAHLSGEHLCLSCRGHERRIPLAS